MSIERDIDRRLRKLEREQPSVRLGVITATAPLTVTLGGSGTAYTSVKRIGAALSVNDVVAVLVFSNDLLVLGKIV